MRILVAGVEARTFYHGTSAESCQKIASDGFIPSMEASIRHTAFGEGVYFSEKWGYAAGYAAQKAGAISCIIKMVVPNQMFDAQAQY